MLKISDQAFLKQTLLNFWTQFTVSVFVYKTIDMNYKRNSVAPDLKQKWMKDLGSTVPSVPRIVKKKPFNLGWTKNCARFGLSYLTHDINSKLYEELKYTPIYFPKLLVSVREIWSKKATVSAVNCLIKLIELISYRVFVQIQDNSVQY